MKLHKSDRKKQNTIQQAVRRGLPLAGLLAATTLAAGCGETAKPGAIMGESPSSESRQPVIRGDITQAEPTPGAPSGEVLPGPAPEGIPVATPGMPVPPPPPLELPKETAVYVVRSGDTLSRIARSHQVSLAVLKALNHFSNEQAGLLQVGQKIIVPAKSNRDNENVVPVSTLGKPAPSGRK